MASDAWLFTRLYCMSCERDFEWFDEPLPRHLDHAAKENIVDAWSIKTAKRAMLAGWRYSDGCTQCPDCVRAK